MSLDVNALRAQFPVLHQEVNGKPLVYLDNAATTQKPQVVIDAVSEYYRTVNSNVHRAAHYLSDHATASFEAARADLAAFINAAREEVILTKGTTEGINLVAQCLGRERLQAGDEILITALEHHANIVPWQQVCERTGATLQVTPLREDGSVDTDAFHQLLTAPSVEEGLARTVALGGDTDTNAAIAGALLGAVHGARSLPLQWVDRVLTCRPLAGEPGVHRPRPRWCWPVDALFLAERLVSLGARAAAPAAR